MSDEHTSSVTLQSELTVKFTDAKKAEPFFFDSDWSKSFYDFNSMNDLADHVAWSFHQATEYYDNKVGARCRSFEGFVAFIADESGSYVSDFEEYGKIIIEIESELEAV